MHLTNKYHFYFLNIVTSIKLLQHEITTLTDVYIGSIDYLFIKDTRSFSQMHNSLIILFITTSQLSNFMNDFFQTTQDSVKWIYFHHHKFKKLKLFDKTNIPLSHEIYTIPIIENSTTTNITEHYNIEPWKNVQENQIGFWSLNQGVVIKESFSNRRMNLKNLTFLISTKHAPPFISLDNQTHPTKITSGFFGHIWNILQDKQNFR